MAVVRYTKAYHSTVIPPKKTVSKRRSLVSLTLMSLGLLLLASVVIPLTSFVFTRKSTTPTSSERLTVKASEAVEYLLPTPKPTPVVVAQELDYLDLSSWFPEQEFPILPPQQAKTYTLSIPVLGIESAQVLVGGTDLDKSLIQYPGTAAPGELGSPVIFGHSVLRQFYNPKITNPRRYISIFSTIMTLKEGEEIFVTDDGVTYRYVVVDKVDVKPTDRYILQQDKNVRQLKLVTCRPEGTYLFRGVVTAVLAPK